MEEKMEVRQITMDKKVEHWQITLDGFITCHSGGSPAPIPKPKDLPTGARSEILVKWSDAVCGLKVHWRIEIDVEIEDDEYKHGEGRCSIVSIDPFADPPGLYKSEPISVPIITADNRKMNTPFVEKPVFVVKKGTKNGRQLELDLYFQTNESEVLGYGVAYKCTLNEKEAEKKVEYWKEKKHKMPKEISEKLFEPFPYRINVLLVDGWSKSEGKAGSVTHEVVKVKRIIKDK